VRRYCRYCPRSAVCYADGRDPAEIWFDYHEEMRLYCRWANVDLVAPRQVVEAHLKELGWDVTPAVLEGWRLLRRKKGA